MPIDDVERLIPHRNRMKLIDEIIAVDEKMAVTASTITETWPLLEGASVNPVVLVELVAQTAAVCIGWKERQEKGDDLGGTGWLVGIKEAVFHRRHLPLNSQILTTSKKMFQFEHYSEIAGTVSIENEMIAEIKLQVVKGES